MLNAQLHALAALPRQSLDWKPGCPHCQKVCGGMDRNLFPCKKSNTSDRTPAHYFLSPAFWSRSIPEYKDFLSMLLLRFWRCVDSWVYTNIISQPWRWRNCVRTKHYLPTSPYGIKLKGKNRHRHHYDSLKYSIATCLLLSLTQVCYGETHLLLLFHKNVSVANLVWRHWNYLIRVSFVSRYQFPLLAHRACMPRQESL